MADETEEIVSESRKIPKKPYKGLTPGQAGLFATIASAPAGPLAPVIGLGTALFAKIRRDNYNDEQARYLDNLAEENAGLQKVLDREDEIADPNEKRRLLIAQQLRTDGYMRLAAGDASGDQLVKQAYNIAQNIVETDTQFDNQEKAAEFQAQRSLITNSANSLRGDFHATVETVQNAQKAADEIFALVNDPNFDPNNPTNKARLADLIQMGGLMFRDTPDAMDAVMQGAGSLQSLGRGGAVAGGAIEGIATYMKSKDFKVTPEIYNRLALNMKRASEEWGTRRLQRIGEEARSLDTWGKKRGVLEQDMSFADYVSGGQKELRLTPVPKVMRTEHIDSAENERRREIILNDPQTVTRPEPYEQRHGTIERKRPTN